MHFENCVFDCSHLTRIVPMRTTGVMDRFLDRVGVNSDTGGAMTAEAYMFGPFRVVGRDGSELTPTGQLRRAILAVLLMSPGRSCTKQYLVDLFWAQSEPTKSRASLRTALSTLKKELAPLGDEVITSDRYHVRLTGQALTVSVGQRAESAQLPFLQDLDVDARGADGFEEWLRDMRLRHSPSAEETPQRVQLDHGLVRMVSADHLATRDLALGLLPCRMSTDAPIVETRANLVVDRLLDTLSVPCRSSCLTTAIAMVWPVWTKPT